MFSSSIPLSEGSKMKDAGISRRSILLAGGGVILGSPVISSGVSADKGSLDPCPPGCTWHPGENVCYCLVQPIEPPDDEQVPGEKGLNQAEGKPGAEGREIARKKQQGK
jgi:hypothetical protein